MLKNKIFCFDEKKPPVFVKKIGCQIKFFAYVIYEWYLTSGEPAPRIDKHMPGRPPILFQVLLVTKMLVN